jgi:predicted HTH domain antitoxin
MLQLLAYMPTVSVRIGEDEKEALDDVAALLEQDRSTTMRQALREGLETIRTRHAVERYQSDDVSVNEAARLAGVSIAEWLEIAHEWGLTTQLAENDLSFDAERAQEL